MVDKIVLRLLRLDACAVSDALDKLGLDGCVAGLPPQTGDKRIAGRIRTVKLSGKESSEAAQAAPRHLGTEAIMSAEAGDIIVVEQRTGMDAGSWGGILSLGAKLRQVAGVIADGPIRDVDEARQLDFPIYARGRTARTARGRVVEIGTNVPVTIGDVVVNPGDYVIADGSAVVFIRASDAESVIVEAERIFKREAAMAEALMQGEVITEVMGADYEHMLR